MSQRKFSTSRASTNTSDSEGDLSSGVPQETINLRDIKEGYLCKLTESHIWLKVDKACLV